MNTRISIAFSMAFSMAGMVGTACHPSQDEPISNGDAELVEPEVEPGETPADAATIASLLRARHTEDLPSAEDLAKYPTAEASLRHLAMAGDSMVVRTRAMMLLRHFGSAETGTLLVSLVRDAELHPALRAAAVTGLAGQPIDDRPEQLELITAALHDADPRVGLAAVDVLDLSKSGRRELERALSREDLHVKVRSAIESRR